MSPIKSEVLIAGGGIGGLAVALAYGLWRGLPPPSAQAVGLGRAAREIRETLEGLARRPTLCAAGEGAKLDRRGLRCERRAKREIPYRETALLGASRRRG